MDIYFDITPPRPVNDGTLDFIRETFQRYAEDEEAIRLNAEFGGGFPNIEGMVPHTTRISGTVKLPRGMNVDDLMYMGEHWVEIIAIIRRKFPDWSYTVEIYGDAMIWDHRLKRYDLP